MVVILVSDVWLLMDDDEVDDVHDEVVVEQDQLVLDQKIDERLALFNETFDDVLFIVIVLTNTYDDEEDELEAHDIIE